MKSAEFCVFGGYAGYKFEHVHSSTSDGNEGYPKGKPLWLWVSNRGEQHPCWHTTFLGKSSVLYLCGADGSRNCSTPRKVWLQLRRSGGKGCPMRGSISDRKRLAGGAGKHCLSAVSFAEQRYIKAPVSRCLPSFQNHHGRFPRRLSIASPSTFFVRLSLRWKWSAAPISGCSIPSVKP